MDSILKSWEQKGLKTMDEVRSGDRKPDENTAVCSEPAASGNAELDRMKEYLEKLKKRGE